LENFGENCTEVKKRKGTNVCPRSAVRCLNKHDTKPCILYYSVLSYRLKTYSFLYLVTQASKLCVNTIYRPVLICVSVLLPTLFKSQYSHRVLAYLFVCFWRDALQWTRASSNGLESPHSRGF